MDFVAQPDRQRFGIPPLSSRVKIDWKAENCGPGTALSAFWCSAGDIRLSKIKIESLLP